MVFELEADWHALDQDRNQQSEERPGLVRWTDPDGRENVIPIEIKTRGNFRLRRSTCFFPPIRLDFPRNGTPGTVFQGQNKIKVVTHCRNRDSYEQNLLEEYLAYRIYGLVTDFSLRVRLARITYSDISGTSPPVTRMAFLVEDRNAMAERLGGRIMDVQGVPPSHLRQDQAVLMYLFQFMIGNTDWALSRLHNVKVLGVGSDYFPIPYDFDWSGLVEAPYAGPRQTLAGAIDNVRERLYLGACDEAIDYQAAFERLKGRKEEILALPASVSELTDANRRWATDYLEGFFRMIEGGPATRERIQNACRTRGC